MKNKNISFPIRIKGDLPIYLLEKKVNYKYKADVNETIKPYKEKISIVNDKMFKAMLNNQDRINYSAKLFSTILDISYEEFLHHIVLINNELKKETPDTKVERCDYVANFNGIILNLEMNNVSSVETMDRNVLYATRLFDKDLKSGDSYNKLNYVVQINLNNFSYEGKTESMEIFTLKNAYNEIISDKIIIINIYIPIIRKKWYDEIDLNDMEKCILAMVERDIESLEQLLEGNDIMENYVNEATHISLEEIMRGVPTHEEAEKQGLISNAYNEGYDKGETEKAKEMIHKFYKNGASLELIAASSDLTIEEVQNILNGKEEDND